MNYRNFQMAYLNYEILKSASGILKPQPEISGTEFVKNHFYAQSGKITPYPWQEEILNCCMDRLTDQVSIIKPSRVGYTEVIIGSRIAYSIKYDPSNILLAQPTDTEAYEYADDNLSKMFENNLDIKEIISTPSGFSQSKKKEKTRKKNFPGGWLEVIGAHSPKNFRRRSAKTAIGDEIDGWAIGAGNEGDQLQLLKRRTADYYDGKVIVGSTPTIKGRSKIEKLFESGDKRRRHYYCPECKKLHTWELKQLIYDVGPNGNVIKTSVKMSCPHCGFLYGQEMQRKLDLGGVWIAEKEFYSHASFAINGFMSYSPKTTWFHIAQEYEDAKKDKVTLMQPFMNTVIGETYEEDRDVIDEHSLMKRREKYNYEVPDGVNVIVMSVDTQNDRLEWKVIGFTCDVEMYAIDKGIIYGDPAQHQPWEELESIFDNKKYETDDGEMSIYAMGIDSGGGRTSHVYAFCEPRLHKKIYALKGSSILDAGEVSRKIVRDKGSPHFGTTYFSVGVTRVKDIISVGLRNQKGRYHIHFPLKKGFDLPYFEQ
ncbi:MAG: phage terminase large subunit family protein, partial [Sulfurovum sp.]|nr:phage terminase large subunit family protein [Sulfurovum sp.]